MDGLPAGVISSNTLHYARPITALSQHKAVYADLRGFRLYISTLRERRLRSRES